MNGNYSAISLYYKDVGEYKLLTREEELKLGEDVQKGGLEAKAAVDKLVTSNLRLVVKIAQDFMGRGVALEDLICEGNVGLHTAATKFNPSKGARFSYYSSFWIRQNILRAISNYGRLVRIPVNSLCKYSKILRYIKERQEKNDETPTKSEIASRFNISKKRLAEIMTASNKVVPLDSEIVRGSGSKIHDVIPDEALTPCESSCKKDDYSMMFSLVDKLPKREKFIIENRFGLGGRGEKVTLENLGIKLKVTRERVRQIEVAALLKLRGMVKGKIEK
jgi:RNA polymerase sigma factor (sigma-70 family)